MKMKNPTALTRSLNVWLKGILRLLGIMMLWMAAGGAGMQAFGAIEWSGNVDPSDPRLWNLNTDAWIGFNSSGSVTVNNGSQLFSNTGLLGELQGITGTVTVTGNGSKWTNKQGLYIGFLGNGVLNIEAGGQVSHNTEGAYMGWSNQSTATVHVTGSGSAWNPKGALLIGMSGKATITIDEGGKVTTPASYVGYQGTNPGTVTVSGAGSKFVSDSTYVGYNGCTGILNIGTGQASGGLMAIKSLVYTNYQSTSKAICNLNGGTLQMGTMQNYYGSVDFNWSDGTIRNYDAATDLSISGAAGLGLALASTGTHAFNIDSGRFGTVDAVLCDATSGGTLTKTGQGTLALTATNTYSGDTYLEAGTLSIRNRYLNDLAGVHIAAGAKFDLDYAGSDTVEALYLNGLPMVPGTWGSSSSSATHIDNLHFSGAGMLNVTNVPEPSTLAMLLTVVLGGLLWRRRRA